jgi:exodeoxyribonuclease V gamma subunit
VQTAYAGPLDDEAGKAWRKQVEKDHPLQPFSPLNFQGDEASFDAQALRTALALAGQREERPFAEALPLRQEGLAPDLDTLLNFWRDPAKAWLQALGLRLAPRAEDPARQDDEPVDLDDQLLRWELLDEALRAELGAAPVPFLARRLAADRLLPAGELGAAQGASLLAEAKDLVRALRRHGQGEALPVALSADWGGGELQGVLQRANASAPWQAWTAGKLENAGFILRAWTQACLASAAGQPGPLLTAGRDKDGLGCRWLPAPEPGLARRSLARLCQLQQEGRQRLLPFAPETSWALAQAQRDGQEPLEKAQDAWYGGDFKRGELEKPSYALAWRGQEALEAASAGPWLALARDLLDPVIEWWEQGQDPEKPKAEIAAQPKAAVSKKGKP